MATGPGDDTAAGRGRLRASHADREEVIGMLKAAFVQGRLTSDELDVRVGQTLAARTCADLAVLTADIPAGLAAARPATPRARRPVKKVLTWSACWFITPAILVAGLLPDNHDAAAVALSSAGMSRLAVCSAVALAHRPLVSRLTARTARPARRLAS